MKKIGTIGLMTLISLMGLFGGVSAQTEGKLSVDTIVLGDQTVLSIPEGVNCPSTELLSQNGVEALSQRLDSTSGTILTTLTSFEPGIHYIKLGSDDSLSLTVLDVEIDTTSSEIRDIADIENVSYTFWEIFRWILLGLGVLALGFGGWWVYTHRRKIKEMVGVEVPVDTRTAEERALDKLEALRQKQMWLSGRTKEYHTELTDIVRTFIEETTGIRATEMTSEECLNALTNTLTHSLINTLKDIFFTADLVKFAKSEPLPYEHQRALNNAVEFVKGMWVTLNSSLK